MKSKERSQITVCVEETVKYEIELGSIPAVNWKSSSGDIHAQIPYDGRVLKEDASGQENYRLGHLELVLPVENLKDKLTLEMKAGPEWQEYIKSGKRAVCRANYNIPEPKDALIVVEKAEIVDDAFGDEPDRWPEIIQGKLPNFDNPLALRLVLWVPDLWAQTRLNEKRELETLLLDGQNTRQIFLAQPTTSDFGPQLAKALVALANTYGGRILIGVGERGKVVGLPSDLATFDQLNLALVKAALTATPPVPVLECRPLIYAPGRVVFYVEVPASGTTARHRLKGTIYRRRGKQTVEESGPPTVMPTTAPPAQAEGDGLEHLFKVNEAGQVVWENSEDGVVLDAHVGLGNLYVGAYFCGLINAGRKAGRIIIRNPLSLSTEQFGFLRRRNALQVLETYLHDELTRLVPQLASLPLTVRQVGKEQVVVLDVSTSSTPVALYNGQAYIWEDRSLKKLAPEKTLQKYVSMAGHQTGGEGDRRVRLEGGRLGWPIRPPRLPRPDENPTYDIQFQAQAWTARSFDLEPNTIGYSCSLKVPLSHATLKIGGNGQVEVEGKDPVVKGKIIVCLHDLLASGLTITPHLDDQDEDEENWLPLVKKTFLHLDVTARLHELFKRRVKASFLRFLVADVILDPERQADLVQACADVGFRVYPDQPDPEDRPPNTIVGIIRGIRAYKYYDILLLVGLVCERNDLTRELYYVGRHDLKTTQTAVLDVRVFLKGEGEGVDEEISRLQLQLYQAIYHRLQHLHVE